MANLSFTKTFSDDSILPAADLNTLQSDVSSYINARNGGGTAWDALYSSSSSNVPLTLNNSTGTQDICRMQDNGTNVFQLYNGGILTLGSQSGCFVYKSAAAQTAAAATDVTIVFDAEVFDKQSEFDTGTYRFTASKTGIYLFTLGLSYSTGVTTSGTMLVSVRSATTFYATDAWKATASISEERRCLSGCANLTAGEYLYCVFTNGVGNSNVSILNSGGAAATKFSVNKIA